MKRAALDVSLFILFVACVVAACYFRKPASPAPLVHAPRFCDVGYLVLPHELIGYVTLGNTRYPLLSGDTVCLPHAPQRPPVAP